MEYGTVQRPKAGNLISGDSHLIHEAGARVIVAVGDGLGSGEKAARSAQLAMQGVAEHRDAVLVDILAYCHYTLLAAGGVGVMMTILRLDQEAGRLEYAGVGNVRFQAHSRRVIQPITRYGYLGVRLPTLHGAVFDYDPGDAFLLHTDGISSRFHLSNHIHELQTGAQRFAEIVLQEYRKDHDDATLVVVKT